MHIVKYRARTIGQRKYRSINLQIRGGDLDEAKAQEAKRQAEELMQNQDSTIDYAKAQAELAAAIAQLAAIQKLRSKGR